MTMTTTTTNALSATKPPAQASVWSGYKDKLMEAGVMDLQRQRPIQIKAINIGNSAENSMRDDDDDDGTDSNSNNSNDEEVITKIIHFQRHGQGYHNLLGDLVRSMGNDIEIDDPNPETNPFVKPEIQDSPLTFQGRTEAASQRYKASMLSPEVIIVSPLQRAIQTAQLSFVDHIMSNTDKKDDDDDDDDVDVVPFIAHEGCREQLGFLTCNKALPLSQMKMDYPLVDFSLITHGEDDTLWNQYDTREKPIDEANRAYDFLTEFVMKRKEKEMAIVCHSAWLFSVCNAVVDCGGDDSLESWFATGEIRSMRVSFHKQKL